MNGSGSARLRSLALAAFAAASLCSCWRLSTPNPQPSFPVQVEQFSATFDAEDRGEFTLGLLAHNPETEAGHAHAIEWELWLNGRRFAEGMQAIDHEIKVGENRFSVTIPLTLRKRQLVRGPVRLRVGIRGRLVVVYGKTNEWLAFAKQLETTVANAPVWTTTEED